MYAAAQLLLKYPERTFPGTMAGVQFHYSCLLQLRGHSSHLFVAGAEQMEATYVCLHGLFRESPPHLRDDDVNPGMGPAVKYHKTVGRSQPKRLFVGEVIRAVSQEARPAVHARLPAGAFKPRSGMGHDKDTREYPGDAIRLPDSGRMPGEDTFRQPDIMAEEAPSGIAVLRDPGAHEKVSPAIRLKEGFHPERMVIVGMGQDGSIDRCQINPEQLSICREQPRTTGIQ